MQDDLRGMFLVLAGRLFDALAGSVVPGAPPETTHAHCPDPSVVPRLAVGMAVGVVLDGRAQDVGEITRVLGWGPVGYWYEVSPIAGLNLPVACSAPYHARESMLQEAGQLFAPEVLETIERAQKRNRPKPMRMPKYRPGQKVRGRHELYGTDRFQVVTIQSIYETCVDHVDYIVRRDGGQAFKLRESRMDPLPVPRFRPGQTVRATNYGKLRIEGQDWSSFGDVVYVFGGRSEALFEEALEGHTNAFELQQIVLWFGPNEPSTAIAARVLSYWTLQDTENVPEGAITPYVDYFYKLDYWHATDGWRIFCGANEKYLRAWPEGEVYPEAFGPSKPTEEIEFCRDSAKNVEFFEDLDTAQETPISSELHVKVASPDPLWQDPNAFEALGAKAGFDKKTVFNPRRLGEDSEDSDLWDMSNQGLMVHEHNRIRFHDEDGAWLQCSPYPGVRDNLNHEPIASLFFGHTPLEKFMNGGITPEMRCVYVNRFQAQEVIRILTLALKEAKARKPNG